MRIQLFKQPPLKKLPKTPYDRDLYLEPNHCSCFGYCENCGTEFYGIWTYGYHGMWHSNSNIPYEKRRGIGDKFNSCLATEMQRTDDDRLFYFKKEYDFAVESALNFYRTTKCPACGAPFERKKGFFALNRDAVKLLEVELSDTEKAELTENEEQYRSDNTYQENDIIGDFEAVGGLAEYYSSPYLSSHLPEILSVFPGIKKQIPLSPSRILRKIDLLYYAGEDHRPLHIFSKRQLLS